ncbi:MAG TPA: PDZ domain-containing protein [Longimicrobium sp.]|nr:PDZ domain-containing protein [Longimicrobium sp.]
MTNRTPTAPYIVAQVVDGSPAAGAGLAIGDRILMVNGSVPGEMDPLFPNIAPGRRYRLQVQRGDQLLELELVAAPPRPAAAH